MRKSGGFCDPITGESLNVVRGGERESDREFDYDQIILKFKCIFG